MPTRSRQPLPDTEQCISADETLTRAFDLLGKRWTGVMLATLRDSEPLADEAPLRKPPSKLYNAWLAGVPAILSSDDAFQELRQSHLDFLEANDVPGLIARVKELKADPSLRRAMVEHGRARAVDFTASRIASMWVDIIQDRILPGYLRWRRSALHRGSSLVSRNLVGKLKPTLW